MMLLADDARQATGTPENNRELIDWTRGSLTPAHMDRNGDDERQLTINTLDGAMWVHPGDVIVQVAREVFAVRRRTLVEPSIDDILSASDQDILEDFRADGGEPSIHAAYMRLKFEDLIKRLRR